MPANLFYSTGIPVCVPVLKKCRRHEQILFEITRYSRQVSLSEIKENDFNLNITRYVNLSKKEEQIDLFEEVNKKLVALEKEIQQARDKHNEFLKELGLPPLV